MNNPTGRIQMRLHRILGKRRLVFLVTMMVGMLFLPMLSRPTAVSAHPLGNFTVDQYSRIEPSLNSVRIRYILDMAEIPAFTEMSEIDIDNDGVTTEIESNKYSLSKAKELGNSLSVEIDGTGLDLIVENSTVEFPSGQGGLNTLRLEIDFFADLPNVIGNNGYSLEYQDKNFPNKLGWKELLIQPTPGVILRNSSVSDADVSNELTAYPEDRFSSPPNLLGARVAIEIDSVGSSIESSSVNPIVTDDSESDNFLASLISADKLSLPIVVMSLLIAVGLGAVHAMSPGHGKTIMAAYLVGTRGTAIHAIFLGFTVTTTHTIGVVALGLVVLYASHVVAPEALYSWLSLASGLIILGVGGWLLWSQLRRRNGTGSEHGHSHDHNHDHGHQHEPGKSTGGLKVTWTTLTALGITGGIIPSASALVILLAAISMHRIGFGMVLILAFGAGMAGVLTGVGLALVYVRNTVERIQTQHRLLGVAARFMPMASALVVLGSGIFMSARSAMQFASI
jgi:ABC-type nickel/cobalt efflux system permease component RcnA